MKHKLCPSGHGAFTDPAELCPECGAILLHDQRGRIVGDGYRLESLLTLGGMRASLWEGVHVPSGRAVVVKLLKRPSGAEVFRFLRGAHIASDLRHPHIGAVLGYGETQDEALYLVMERLIGHPLDRLLARGLPSLELTLSLLVQLLSALDHVHAHGAIHRDVKPGNLFVSQLDDHSWHLHLVDFGIATRAESDTLEAMYADDLPILQHHEIVGTPEYMAPEQIVGASLDARVDVYGAGVTAFRLLTGRLPYRRAERAQVYRAHLRAPLPPLAAPSDRAPFPAGLEEVVHGALAKRRRDRIQSAAGFRRALGDFSRVTARRSA